ncbi:PEP-CTERM sorting domain-containing protein [Phragmitibacter flavus]|uniref:PEP-CTERM sorting domain-containing protein n=1 Tax=Phragmitibacter flavus TaxID=2576071 RepID=A0A5R8KFW9_9BACT|nr:PEP-CTERM sorting domain-containing protein [Phragmitibacter flavus]TLD71207.1 PEP-CTERM sorting domain-containing protein [Phragmitibacter flavus]
MKNPALSHLLPVLGLVISLICVLPIPGHAALTYSGTPYSEGFNGLASTGPTTWINDVTVPGWHWAISNTPPTGYSTPATYTAANGSGPAQSAILSIGNNADRALGSQNGNVAGQSITFGLSFTNATGNTLNNFTLGYTGEHWRAITGDTFGPNTLQLQYQVFTTGPGSLTEASGWLDADHLDYTSTTIPAGNTGQNGNLPENRSVISGIVFDINWQVGQTLWIRWVDTNAATDAGNNATLSMVGIDDVTFTAAVPEPARGLLFLAAIGAFTLRRRRFLSYNPATSQPLR